MEINIRSRQTSIWLEKWFVLITGHLSVQQDTGGKQGAVLWAHNKWCGCLIEMGNKTLNASWHADLQPERTQTPISIMEWTTNKQSQDIRRGCVYICVSVCVKSRLMNNVWIISFCTNERISVQQKKQTNNKPPKHQPCSGQIWYREPWTRLSLQTNLFCWLLRPHEPTAFSFFFNHTTTKIAVTVQK